MKKVLFSIFLLCIGFTAFGQSDTLAPILLATTGGYDTAGGINIAFSVGEPVITTLQNPAFPGPANIYLTQGFNQPISNKVLNFMLTHNDESCLDSKDGSAFLDITGGTPPYKINWSSDPIDNTNGIDSLPPGSYAVTVTDANGLTKNATFVVIASEAVCKIHIYTGITPNGDGHDDTWVIDNIEVFPDNSVELYNRWGSEVWHATGYDNSKVVWRGENQNGKPLPDGTYYYIVKANGTTYKGWVQLTR